MIRTFALGIAITLTTGTAFIYGYSASMGEGPFIAGIIGMLIPSTLVTLAFVLDASIGTLTKD